MSTQPATSTVTVQMNLEDAIMRSMPYGKSNWITMHDLRTQVGKIVVLADDKQNMLYREVRRLVKQGTLQSTKRWTSGFSVRKAVLA